MDIIVTHRMPGRVTFLKSINERDDGQIIKTCVATHSRTTRMA